MAITIQTFEAHAADNTPLKGNAGIIYVRNASGSKTRATNVTMRPTDTNGNDYYYSLDDVLTNQDALGQITVLQESGQSGFLFTSYIAKPSWATSSETVFYPPERIETFLRGNSTAILDINDPPRNPSGGILWSNLAATGINSGTISTTLSGITHRWTDYTDAGATSIEIINGHDAYAEFTPFRPPQCNLDLIYQYLSPNIELDTRIRIRVTDDQNVTHNLFTGLVKELSWTDEITQTDPIVVPKPPVTGLNEVGVWNASTKQDLTFADGDFAILSDKKFEYAEVDNEDHIIPALTDGGEYLLHTANNITSLRNIDWTDGLLFQPTDITDEGSERDAAKVIDYNRLTGDIYEVPADLRNEVTILELVDPTPPPVNLDFNQAGIWNKFDQFSTTYLQNDRKISILDIVGAGDWYVQYFRTGWTMIALYPNSLITDAEGFISVQIDSGPVHRISRITEEGRRWLILWERRNIFGLAPGARLRSGVELKIIITPTVVDLESKSLWIVDENHLRYSVTDNEDNSTQRLKVNAEYIILTSNSLNDTSKPNLTDGSRIFINWASGPWGVGDAAYFEVNYSNVSGAIYTHEDLDGEISLYEVDVTLSKDVEFKQIGIWDNLVPAVDEGELFINNPRQFQYSVIENSLVRNALPPLIVANHYLIYTADSITGLTVPPDDAGSIIQVTAVSGRDIKEVTYNQVARAVYDQQEDLSREVAIYNIVVDQAILGDQIGIWTPRGITYTMTGGSFIMRSATRLDYSLVTNEGDAAPALKTNTDYILYTAPSIVPDDPPTLGEGSRIQVRSITNTGSGNAQARSVTFRRISGVNYDEQRDLSTEVALYERIVTPQPDILKVGSQVGIWNSNARSTINRTFTATERLSPDSSVIANGWEIVKVGANSVIWIFDGGTIAESMFPTNTINSNAIRADIRNLNIKATVQIDSGTIINVTINRVLYWRGVRTRLVVNGDPFSLGGDGIRVTSGNVLKITVPVLSLSNGDLSIQSATAFEYNATDNEDNTVPALTVGNTYLLYTADDITNLAPADLDITIGSRIRITAVADSGSGDTAAKTVTYAKVSGLTYDTQDDLDKETALYDASVAVISNNPVGIWDAAPLTLPAGTLNILSATSFECSAVDKNGRTVGSLFGKGHYVLYTAASITASTAITTVSPGDGYNIVAISPTSAAVTDSVSGDTDVKTLTYTKRPGGVIYDSNADMNDEAALYLTYAGGDLVLGDQIGVWDKAAPTNSPKLTTGTFIAKSSTQFEYTTTDNESNAIGNLTVGSRYLIYTSDTNITSTTRPTLRRGNTTHYNGSYIRVTAIEDIAANTVNGTAAGKLVTYTLVVQTAITDLYDAQSDLNNEITIYEVYNAQLYQQLGIWDVGPRTPFMNPGNIIINSATEFEYSTTDNEDDTIAGLTVGNEYILYTAPSLSKPTLTPGLSEGSVIKVTSAVSGDTGDYTFRSISYTRVSGHTYDAQADLSAEVAIYNVSVTEVPDVITLDEVGIWTTKAPDPLRSGSLNIIDDGDLEYSATDNENRTIGDLTVGRQYLLWSDKTIARDTTTDLTNGSRILVTQVTDLGSSKLISYVRVSGDTYEDNSDLDSEVALYEIDFETKLGSLFGIWNRLDPNTKSEHFLARSATRFKYATTDNEDDTIPGLEAGKYYLLQTAPSIDPHTRPQLTDGSTIRVVDTEDNTNTKSVTYTRISGATYDDQSDLHDEVALFEINRTTPEPIVTRTPVPDVTTIEQVGIWSAAKGTIKAISATALEYQATDNEGNAVTNLKIGTDYIVYTAASITSTTTITITDGSRIRVTAVREAGTGATATRHITYTKVSGATYDSTSDFNAEVAIYEIVATPQPDKIVRTPQPDIVARGSELGSWNTQTIPTLAAGKFAALTDAQLMYSTTDNEGDTIGDLTLGLDYIYYTAAAITSTTKPTLSDSAVSRIFITNVRDVGTGASAGKLITYRRTGFDALYDEQSDLSAEVALYETTVTRSVGSKLGEWRTINGTPSRGAGDFIVITRTSEPFRTSLSYSLTDIDGNTVTPIPGNNFYLFYTADTITTAPTVSDGVLFWGNQLLNNTINTSSQSLTADASINVLLGDLPEQQIDLDARVALYNADVTKGDLVGKWSPATSLDVADRFRILSATQFEIDSIVPDRNTGAIVEGNVYIIYTAATITTSTTITGTDGSLIRITDREVGDDYYEGVNRRREDVVISYERLSGAVYDDPSDLNTKVALYNATATPAADLITVGDQVGIWNRAYRLPTTGSYSTLVSGILIYSTTDADGDTVGDLTVGTTYLISVTDSLSGFNGNENAGVIFKVDKIEDGPNSKIVTISNTTSAIRNVVYNIFNDIDDVLADSLLNDVTRIRSVLPAGVSIWEVDSTATTLSALLSHVGRWSRGTDPLTLYSETFIAKSATQLEYSTTDNESSTIGDLKVGTEYIIYTASSITSTTKPTHTDGSRIKVSAVADSGAAGKLVTYTKVSGATYDDQADLNTEVALYEIIRTPQYTVTVGSQVRIFDRQTIPALTSGDIRRWSNNFFEYSTTDNDSNTIADLTVGDTYIVGVQVGSTVPSGDPGNVSHAIIRVDSIENRGSGFRLVKYTLLKGEATFEPGTPARIFYLWEIDLTTATVGTRIGTWTRNVTEGTRPAGLIWNPEYTTAPFSGAFTPLDGTMILGPLNQRILDKDGRSPRSVFPNIRSNEELLFITADTIPSTTPSMSDGTVIRITQLARDGSIFQEFNYVHISGPVLNRSWFLDDRIAIYAINKTNLAVGDQVGIWDTTGLTYNVSTGAIVPRSATTLEYSTTNKEGNTVSALTVGNAYLIWTRGGLSSGSVIQVTAVETIGSGESAGVKVTYTRYSGPVYDELDDLEAVVHIFNYTITEQPDIVTMVPQPDLITIEQRGIWTSEGSTPTGNLAALSATSFRYFPTDNEGDTITDLKVGTEYIIYTADAITSSTTVTISQGSRVRVSAITGTTTKTVTYTHVGGAKYEDTDDLSAEVALYEIVHTPQPDIVTSVQPPDIVNLGDLVGIWNNNVTKHYVINPGSLIADNLVTLTYSISDNESNTIGKLKTNTEYIVYTSGRIDSGTPPFIFEGSRILVKSVTDVGSGPTAARQVTYEYISGEHLVIQADLRRDVGIYEITVTARDPVLIDPGDTPLSPLYRASLSCYGNSIVAQDLTLNSSAGTTIQLLDDCINLLARHNVTLFNRLRTINQITFWRNVSAPVFDVLSNVASNNHNYPARLTEDGDGNLVLLDTTPNEVLPLAKGIRPGTGGNEQFRSALDGIKYDQYNLVEIDGKRDFFDNAFIFEVNTGTPPLNGAAPTTGQQISMYNGSINTTRADFKQNDKSTWRPNQNWMWHSTQRKWYWIGPIVDANGHTYSYTAPNNRVLGNNPRTAVTDGLDILTTDTRTFHDAMDNDMTVAKNRAMVTGTIKQKYPHFTGGTTGTGSSTRIIPIPTLVYEDKRESENDPEDKKVEAAFRIRMRAYEVQEVIYPVVDTEGANVLDMQNHPGLLRARAKDIAATTFRRERAGRYWEVSVTNLSIEEVILIDTFVKFNYSYYGSPASGIITKYSISRQVDAPFWTAKFVLVNNTFTERILDTRGELRISDQGRLRISLNGLLSIDKE